MQHIVMSGRWNVIKFPLGFRANLSYVPKSKEGTIEKKFVIIPIESNTLPIKDTKAGRPHLPENSFGYCIDDTNGDFKFTAAVDTSSDCLLFAGWAVRQTEFVDIERESTNCEVLKNFTVNSWNGRSSTVEVFALLKPGERLVLKLTELGKDMTGDVYRIYFYDGKIIEKIRAYSSELEKIVELIDSKFEESNR